MFAKLSWKHWTAIILTVLTTAATVVSQFVPPTTPVGAVAAGVKVAAPIIREGVDALPLDQAPADAGEVARDVP